jgi:hypothetical protein
LTTSGIFPLKTQIMGLFEAVENMGISREILKVSPKRTFFPLNVKYHKDICLWFNIIDDYRMFHIRKI